MVKEFKAGKIYRLNSPVESYIDAAQGTIRVVGGPKVYKEGSDWICQYQNIPTSDPAVSRIILVLQGIDYPEECLSLERLDGVPFRRLFDIVASSDLVNGLERQEESIKLQNAFKIVAKKGSFSKEDFECDYTEYENRYGGPEDDKSNYSQEEFGYIKEALEICQSQ